ncbi:MAG: [protein-PII] uridylyltransferase [Burkholderiaceae bacterium]|nr:[protein-PII] uridylyltransferase [Burkholderiaceae bacterium]
MDSSRLAVLRSVHRAHRGAAIDGFLSDRNPARLLRRLSGQADRTLRELWSLAALPSSATLVAVGGYGRTEIFPHSDVDLMVLLAAPAQPATERSIEAFIGACWDAGLEIGHSVRTLAESMSQAAGDITVQTSSMEARYIAGDRALFLRLREGIGRQIDPAAYFRAKMLEMRQRHVKFEDTPYSLEPNTKESPGGLRDLHVVIWTARAAGFGTRWTDLATHGLVTAEEARVLRSVERVVRRIRACLHIASGRREDRLVFDLQSQVASMLGFRDLSARHASEELMQSYFQAAKHVTQLNSILIQNLESALFPRPDSPPEAIDSEFRNLGGKLDAIDPHALGNDPAGVLRAFHALQLHPQVKGFTVPTLRAIWHGRIRIDARFRADPANRALFLDILRHPRGTTRTLRSMNQWSVLGRYLPAFGRVVGRMQHDLFHVYTVDQHILMVVRNLRRFLMDEHAHEYPFCSQLMAAFDRPWRLVIAALFHDIAKGRGGDHSQLGRRDARRFCRGHRIDPDDADLIEFLVEHHLTMSSVAQKQDLSDPAVITRFASLVRTEERLVALYLLTVADIRGTSPKVWNAWKGKLLDDLFQAAKHALDGQVPLADLRVDTLRREARSLLNLHAISEPMYERLWAQLDVAYFLRNDASDVAWHARALHMHVDAAKPIVRARVAPIGEGFQVLVYLPDQPALFARICGYFDSKNLSVLDARIHTTRHGYALDSFLVIDPHEGARYRDILKLVELELAQRLTLRGELPPPGQGRMSRRSRSFPIQPSVELRPDERGQHYLLSLTANDRTGLLYAVARVLARHRVNLYTARVTTLGDRVEDVFLVDGPVLSDEREQLELEADLLAALQP